ncbi:MAG TPA: tRNA-dihydrouridine synthase family protein [Anaerolineales bacterium]|nr:tRNA-dihydrouridine synthase family protein [Anaerolineales bacterium]
MDALSTTLTADSRPRFLLRDLPVYGDRCLAPMDGLTDWPFRSLCRAFGSALSYTSFVSAIDILAGRDKAFEALRFSPDERPVIAQLFDDDEDRLLDAALRVQALRPDVIDVNMGCSARCVSGRGAGAGLLQDPVKIGRIIARLTSALGVPVTAKIRLGWDDTARNYLVVARAIEENGGALLAVHGRTRAQGYTGEADWEAIAQVKAHAGIPVLGNGDIRTPEQALRRLADSGCDGIMIGRAALGNPWIFQGRDRSHVPLAEVAPVIEDHLGRMLAFHGADRGLLLFRKHLARYLDLIDLDPDQRAACLTETQLAALAARLRGAGLDIGFDGITEARNFGQTTMVAA